MGITSGPASSPDPATWDGQPKVPSRQTGMRPEDSKGSNGNEVSEAKLAFVMWRRAFCFSGHGETALARVLVNGQHLRASPLERW